MQTVCSSKIESGSQLAHAAVWLMSSGKLECVHWNSWGFIEMYGFWYQFKYSCQSVLLHNPSCVKLMMVNVFKSNSNSFWIQCKKLQANIQRAFENFRKKAFSWQIVLYLKFSISNHHWPGIEETSTLFNITLSNHWTELVSFKQFLMTLKD